MASVDIKMLIVESTGEYALERLRPDFETFDATAETTNIIFADGQVALEGYVVGTHTGEFAGIPATGREIRVPIAVLYDVEEEKIKRARIYFEVPVLMQQLGVGQG